MAGKLTISDKIILSPLWLIALLPLRVLYMISDSFFVVVYYLVRYRRDVVYANLKNSFPEKSEEEIRKISKKFFRLYF